MEEKFLTALIQIGLFAEPNFVINRTEIKIVENHNGDNYEKQTMYFVDGYDKVTKEPISVISRDSCINGQGRQIEIEKNRQVRYFPFFGFNWKYLGVMGK